MDEDCCAVKRCNRLPSIIYSAGKKKISRPVCNRHWDMHCDGEINLKNGSGYRKEWQWKSIKRQRKADEG